MAAILIATDGSERSDRAAATAVGLARALGLPVVACAAIPPYPYSLLAGADAEAEAQYLGAASAQATEHLARIEHVAAGQGVACATEIIENTHPHAAILQSAQTHQVAFIVMASHGRAGVSALLLGSETHKVLTQSSWPVLVLR